MFYIIIVHRFVDKCVKLVEEGKDSETAFLEAASAFNLNTESQVDMESRKVTTNDLQTILALVRVSFSFS